MSRRKSIFLSGQETQINVKHQEELSNEIDQNLRTLALIHPFSDTAKPLLVKDAFLKANKPAFHHVVHYLAVVISAVEFRKRFRWPIISSSDESVFRSTALTYFNDCHSQYKWNFGPFKMQIVLFPGGNEFMKVIIELSKVAMHTVLRETGSSHSMNTRGITLREAQARLQIAEDSFEQLEQFRSKVRSMSNPLKEKTQRLEGLLKRILCKTAIPRHLIDSFFLLTWKSNQLRIIDDKILNPMNELERFVSKCVSLQQLLTIAKPQHLNFDKERMNALGLLNKSQHFNPQIDYDKLFEWFKNAMPDLITALCYKPSWSLSKLEQESFVLDELSFRTDDLLDRIDTLAIDSYCEPSTIEKTDQTRAISINYLNEKLILTPIIDCEAKKYHRISIWEAVPTINSPARIVQHYPLRTVDEIPDGDDVIGSCDFTFRRNIPSKLDPMLMLNTAMQRKGCKPRASPRRNGLPISPAWLNNNNLSPSNSTMIPKDERTIINANRFSLSPLRKSLF